MYLQCFRYRGNNRQRERYRVVGVVTVTVVNVACWWEGNCHHIQVGYLCEWTAIYVCY